MAAKTESPTKLSPTERLARKRAAARLRQQRCRARKREAVLEQRRNDDGAHQGFSRSQDSGSDVPNHCAPSHSSPFGLVPPKRFPLSSPPREPIFNCVSFDSQRSFEEAQRAHGVPMVSRSSSEESLATAEPSSSRTHKVLEIVTAPQTKAEEPLVAEEEAAIAAMLSLKSGSTPPSSPASKAKEESPRPSVTRTSAPPTKYRYYRDWEHPAYESFGYMRHGRAPPPYYGMGMHHRAGAPAPRYGYYPPAYSKGYSRCDYE